MQKYVPVQWFLDTKCMLRRHNASYMEEFSILNAEVPAIYAIPAENVQEILKALKILGGHSELIEYLEFLLKKE